MAGFDRVAPRDEGSFLVEALIGIGMLGAVTAAVTTLLPAVLDADVRATAHHGALMIGESLLEADAAGIGGPVLPSPTFDGAIRVESRIERDGPDAHPLGDGCAYGAARTDVHVEHGGRSDGREVVLRSGAAVSPSAQDGGRDLALRWVGQGQSPAGLVVLEPGGDVRPPTLSLAGCVRFDGLPAGRSWVTFTPEAEVVIDRTHVPLDVRPHSVTLTSRPHELTLDAERAAWLEVEIDARGARLPDHIGRGALRWLVRGDEGDVATDIGVGRSVHPGSVTVVVPGCDDGSATGSTATVDVGPGEHAVVEVPLAAVTVENLRGHTDVRLQLQRSTGCADGVGLLPSMYFEGELHEGMRIALPRGEWEAWLVRPPRRALTPSVRFAAFGTDTLVRLP